MNETLQTAITKLLDTTLNGIDNTTIFLEGQLPDYILQLLLWHGWKSGILCAMGMMLLTTFITIDYKVFKYGQRREWNGEQWFGFMMASGITGVISTVASFSLINLTWLQIWIAPKVFLVEYATNLVK